jgi:Tol biopolymer transport system component
VAAATLLLATTGCVSPASSMSPAGVVSGSPEPSLSEQPSVSEGPSFEPASGRIVFGRYDRTVANFIVYLIDPNGAGESRLPPGGNECPRWSPDGKDISVTKSGDPLESGIFENAGQAGGSFRLLAMPDPPLNLGCPVWSPDGNRLAYEGWDDTDPTRNGIYTLSAADGSDLQRLTSSPNGGHDLPGDYSADGSQLFFERWDGNERSENGPLMVVEMDGSDPQRVATDVFSGLSLSPDGQTLVAGRDGFLYLIAVDGGSVTPITIQNTTFDAFGPSWSPDGSWIVFALSFYDLGDIARVRPDGSGLVQITHDPANEGFADWAP